TWFDKDKMKGEPFAYHTVGTSITEVTVDCLRGTYHIDSVKVVHDFGASFAKQVDLGQAEGGIVQGIGWMTLEEVIYDQNGKLLTDALSTYKIPDIHFAPEEIQVHFLENSANQFAVFNSKAIGEPPFMYGIGAYFAIMNAIKSFNPNKPFKIIAPMTHERTLMYLYL
ncbi:MAG: molybdopterin-dependent oxidoreductase, partial [Ignavibacteria bacterium]|nr:molybdopterin-dependent oxidoreductase [Ignavibacteria bacterium]